MTIVVPFLMISPRGTASPLPTQLDPCHHSVVAAARQATIILVVDRAQQDLVACGEPQFRRRRGSIGDDRDQAVRIDEQTEL